MRLVLVLLAVACAPRHAEDRHAPLGATHAERAGASHARLRTRMRHHGDDLRQIEVVLRHGKLAEAKALAFWLAREDPDVTLATRALHAATDRAGALRATARIAAACGNCHVRIGVPAFARDPRPPDDDGTAAARVARHRWAAARVWDGVVGAAEPPWRAGLEVFAADLGGYRVQRVAARVLEGGYEDRATAYGDLLVACTACHPR